MNWLKLLGLPTLTVCLATVLPNSAQAQITSGGDGTAISPSGSTIDITGGTQAGSNLFHSFGQFNVNAGQTANFVDPGVQNILGRVTGGNASLINGVLQVTGGNANLYLMNPAGIIFGSGASLSVPGSFTATTANGIGFEGNWFNAIASNDYANLIGNPNSFAFTMAQPGAIVNAGNLEVGQGQSITLLGGTVISTGILTAPRGKITVAAVPGERVVSISQDGSLLTLALPAETSTTVNTLPFTPLSLPQLLTGGDLSSATKVTVDNDVVSLVGSGIQIENGDVVSTDTTITAQTTTLLASKNLTLVKSQLHTTGDLNLLAQNTVRTGDILTDAGNVKITAGGDLQTGDIQTAGLKIQFGRNISSVKLEAAGDIEISTIDTGAGGIDIKAGGSFRATGSFENNFSSDGSDDPGLINDPDLINYLLSLGLGFSEQDLLNAKVQIPKAQTNLSLISRPSDGLSGQKSPIKILYGDQKQTIVNRPYAIDGVPNSSSLLILGDSNETFRMGSAFDDGIVFVPLANAKGIYNPTTNNFGFTLNKSRALVYGTAEFPTGVSGLAAGIAIGEGTDSSLYGSFQGYAFTPSNTNPALGGIGTLPGGTDTASGGIGTLPGGTDTALGGIGTLPGGTDTASDGIGTLPGGTDTASDGTGTSSSGTNTASGGTDTSSSGTNTASDGTGTSSSGTNTASDGNPICVPSNTVASASGTFNSNPRSGRATSSANVSSSSCNASRDSSTATGGNADDDTQILKLLDGGVR